MGAVLLRAHEWVLVRDGATLPGEVNMDEMIGIINMGFQMGLVAMCIVSLVEIVREVRRALSADSSGLSAGPACERGVGPTVVALNRRQEIACSLSCDIGAGRRRAEARRCETLHSTVLTCR